MLRVPTGQSFWIRAGPRLRPQSMGPMVLMVTIPTLHCVFTKLCHFILACKLKMQLRKKVFIHQCSKDSKNKQYIPLALSYFITKMCG